MLFADTASGRGQSSGEIRLEITQGTVYQRQFAVTAPGAGLGPVALHHRVGEHGEMALHLMVENA